jgi:hypothetical protein
MKTWRGNSLLLDPLPPPSMARHAVYIAGKGRLCATTHPDTPNDSSEHIEAPLSGLRVPNLRGKSNKFQPRDYQGQSIPRRRRRPQQSGVNSRIERMGYFV